MKHNHSVRALVAAGTLALGATFLGAPAQAAETPAHDLSVKYTVSGAKATGYAGLVGIHVENEGSARYYGEFPMVSFRVDVKTAAGPEGVDRLIAPGWFNGAYTRDLGFNPQTSTRSFLVTLANPVEAGKSQLVANLNFGDGATKEGRLKNYVTVTQLGRLPDDTSFSNDQNVDSRMVTSKDTGGAHSGLF